MRSSRQFRLVLAAALVTGVVAGMVGPRLGIPTDVAKWVVGGVAGAVCLSFVMREERARPPAASGAQRAGEPYVSPYEVRFDDIEVIVTRDGAPDGRVAWADLLTVGVRIDDAFLPEPWWLLFGRTSTVTSYPASARGSGEMLHELQRRLPGFDNAGVARAMGLMEGGVVVWEKQLSAPDARG